MILKEFRLQVFTQEKKVLDQAVISVTAPAADGYIGVWADHAPLVTSLGDGVLTIRTNEGEHAMQLSGGFMEVVGNVATILADSLTEQVPKEDKE